MGVWLPLNCRMLREPDQEPEPEEIWSEVASYTPHWLRQLTSWIELVGNLIRNRFRQRLRALSASYWGQLGRQVHALQGSQQDLSAGTGESLGIESGSSGVS